MGFHTVLARLGITSGTVAITGGTRVFDHFLTIGYSAFALASVPNLLLPDGRPAFSGGPPQAMLSSHGLVAGIAELIDEVLVSP